MKIILYKIGLGISLILLILIIHSCSKKVYNINDQLTALRPVLADSDAGNWKPILLNTPNQIAIPQPSNAIASDYQAELSVIKQNQKNLNPDQFASIQYWAAGNVLRWNEILRELVAKYNLPVVASADGTYPIPSSANPLAYPLFPFSNPPYSARAYAYISAAQYDALVAAYYYKSQYGRKAPYLQDTSIKALVPKPKISSYPSEAAVLAGVTAEMMKLLFPDEVANIQAKAHEAENAALLSGIASQSDINAGDSLGKHVADLFIAKAKKDRAGVAVGNATIWAALESNKAATGEIPWISLENPKRPPMLPLFGNVQSLILDSATLVSLRPGPPPLTSSDEMKQEVNEELQYTLHPTAETIRITQFWADGVGTSTPPGHWNYIASQDFISKNYSEIRWARNLAFLNIGLMDAAIVCWNTKYYYFNPRPSQLNPAIKTLTGVPNFPSYISGHSTFSGAACTILSYLVPENASKYQQMASEASNSRMVSGIHYKIDCSTGLTVGTQVGNYAVQKLKQAGGN